MIDYPAAGAGETTASVALPDPVPAHPLLDGLPELGRGESSIVLDPGDGQRVFKLVSSPADYFYLAADDRPTGLHFPRLFHDHGIIGKASSGYSFRLLEIERLLPESLVKAVAALSDFIEEYPVQPDILNPHNLMMRADGTLVFSDPVFLP